MTDPSTPVEPAPATAPVEPPVSSAPAPAVAAPAPEPTPPAAATPPAASVTAPAAAAPSPAQTHAPASVGTRVIAGVILALSLAATWFFASQAFASDLGTERSSLRLLMRVLSVALPLYPGVLAGLALATGRRPPAQWNPLGVPFEAWWFDTLLTLTWREMKGFFARPVAYVVLFFWMAANGILFLRILDFYTRPMVEVQVPASYYIANNGIIMLILMLTIPALTMRLIAEERATGSLELLLTAPVTHAQVVLAKFLGVFAFFLSTILALTVFLGIMRAYAAPGAWDWGPVFGALLGLCMVGALYCALGLFTSSITDNQIVAYVLAVAPIMLLSIVSWWGVTKAEVLVDYIDLRAAIEYLDLGNKQEDLGRGILRWRTLVFFASSTGMFLFLSVRGLASHTWR